MEPRVLAQQRGPAPARPLRAHGDPVGRHAVGGGHGVQVERAVELLAPARGAPAGAHAGQHAARDGVDRADPARVGREGARTARSSTPSAVRRPTVNEIARCDQQAVAVGPLDHHVGERARRGARPVADHGPQARRRAQAGDEPVDALHADRPPGRGPLHPADRGGTAYRCAACDG